MSIPTNESCSSRLLNPGYIIVACVLVLTLLGLCVLYSATAQLGPDPFFFLRRQVVWLGIALVAGVVCSLMNLDSLRKFFVPVTILSLVALVLVLIPGIGTEVNGARRWIRMGFFNIQVSEFAKLGLVFTLACYLGSNQRRIEYFWSGFVVPCLIIGIFSALIIVQPDYGTAGLCAAVGFTLLFLAGVRLRFVIPAFFSALGIFGVAIYLNPLRLQRIVSFLDVEGNRAEGSYQLWQAILGFGAGGLNGVGLGNGRQQMAFLPEAHTDFIFAVGGEELGFAFTAGVLLLFFILFVVSMFHLRKAPDMYQFLLVAGALFM
ncbi:MAG: FtsW/RodA/SpoVE family cell cycle protein, partial [Opitutales bacterium]